LPLPLTLKGNFPLIKPRRTNCNDLPKIAAATATDTRLIVNVISPQLFNNPKHKPLKLDKQKRRAVQRKQRQNQVRYHPECAIIPAKVSET